MEERMEQERDMEKGTYDQAEEGTNKKSEERIEKIPKIIHYCWFGGKPLPHAVKKYIHTWQAMCPDYEIRRWDERNAPFARYTFAKEAYAEGAWAFVSDVVRLWAVYQYGGIYLDTDVELLKNLDFLRRYSCFLARQQDGQINTGLGFGARKGSEVVYAMLKEYKELSFDIRKKQELSCPVLNTRALEKWHFTKQRETELRNGILVLPPEYMDPYSSGKRVENLMCARTVSIHHYRASWAALPQKWKRSMICTLGEEKLIWIKERQKQKNGV